jgi:hypothetical protein
MGIPGSKKIGTPRTTACMVAGRKRLPLVSLPVRVYPLWRQLRSLGMEAREMADDTDQANQSDPQLLPRQFTTVFEYLINVSGFELPFILVLLDADDIVVRNKIVQNSENGNVLSAMDFVCSEGAEEGLSYPMHMMVRDVNGNAAYGYLDDIDAQPEIQMVHVGEDE